MKNVLKTMQEKYPELEKEVLEGLVDIAENVVKEMTEVKEEEVNSIVEKKINDMLESKDDRGNTMLSKMLGGSGEEVKKENTRRDAMRKFLSVGEKGVTVEEMKMLSTPANTKSVMTSNDFSTGGIFANEDLMSEMEKDFLNYSAVRNLVSVKNTVEKEITFNKSPLSGRTKAYRRGELDEALESGKLKFEKGRVPLYASTSLIKATREDIQYSTAVDLESLIVEEATESFAVAEANEIINGTGVEQAEGILVNKDIEKIKTLTTGVITFEDINGLYVALKGIYRKNAVFGANSVVIKMLMDLKDSSGRPIFFWNKPLTDTIVGDGNARIEATGTLYGKPLYEIPEMPDTVTTGKHMLIFGDFQTGYVLGNRVEMYMLRDENSDAKTGVVNFIFERYFGGAVKRAEAFKILQSK